MNRWLSLPLIVRVGLLCTVGFALLFSLPARAQELVWRNGDVTVRLLTADCPIPQLEQVLADVAKPRARLAIIRIRDRELPACWTFDDEKFYLIDIMGNGGFLEPSALKVDPGV